MKKSIAYLVHECIKKLKTTDNKILLIVSELENMKLLSPKVHFFHHKLQGSMRKQDVVEAGNYLFKLADAILDHAMMKEWISIESISNLEWENFIVEEAKKITLVDCGLVAEIEPIVGADLSLRKDQVGAALCTIARYDPAMFDEIKKHVRMISLFQGKITMGFTDVRILGAMLIRLPREIVNPILYFMEHIIHEASHMHLNCLMASDPLFCNAANDVFVSPLRPDLRPMVGVFHATYVSARVLNAFMKMYLATRNIELVQILAETLDETIRGIFEIEKNALLTVSGRLIIEGIKELIDSAKKMLDWQAYNFSEQKTHRFGMGITKVDALQKAVA